MREGHIFTHLIVSVFAILGADYVDGVILVNSRGLVHIDYMVRVGNEKSKNNILISRKNHYVCSHWIGCVPIKVRKDDVLSMNQRASANVINFIFCLLKFLTNPTLAQTRPSK